MSLHFLLIIHFQLFGNFQICRFFWHHPVFFLNFQIVPNERKKNSLKSFKRKSQNRSNHSRLETFGFNSNNKKLKKKAKHSVNYFNFVFLSSCNCSSSLTWSGDSAQVSRWGSNWLGIKLYPKAIVRQRTVCKRLPGILSNASVQLI